MPDIEIEKIKRLVKVRRELNLNQDQMAHILGIPRTSLSKIENGRDNRDVPYGTKHILQLELNVNPDWFESGVGPMFVGEAVMAGEEVKETKPDMPDGFEEPPRQKIILMTPEQKLTFALERNQEVYDKAMAAQEKNVKLLEEISKLKDMLLEREREIFHIKSPEKNGSNDSVRI